MEQVVGIIDDVCMGVEEIIKALRKKFERVSRYWTSVIVGCGGSGNLGLWRAKYRSQSPYRLDLTRLSNEERLFCCGFL